MSHIFKLIVLAFQCFCVITTSFMLGYWIYKYSRNEDATQIQYKSFDSGENAVYPELTICIVDPILGAKLNEIDHGIDKDMYIKYLKGEIELNVMKDVFSFDEITINLFDYLREIEIVEKSNGNSSVHTCNNTQDCKFVIFKNNYNGFTFREHQFMKCFGIEINTKYSFHVSEIQLFFDETFSNIVDQVEVVYAMFNHPNQMFIFQNKGTKQIWSTNEYNNTVNFFQINSFEILKRRKKSNTHCYANWQHYDETVLFNKIKTVGCRTPYQQFFQQFPVCKNRSKMKEAIYNLDDIADNFLPPCQEVSHLSYTHSPIRSSKYYFKNNVYPLTISYPEKIKMITQSQAIDVHSLIGNIGGYIGLFLGMFQLNFKILLKRNFIVCIGKYEC